MSTNLEYRERERQWERENRRQASEAQREKERRRARARDMESFFVGRTIWICSRGEKMRNASGHPDKSERHWKKSEQEHVRHFLHKSVTREFLDVSLCCRAKQRQINVQKSVLHEQSFFCFCLLDLLLFFTVLFAFAASHYTILYLVWANYKYYWELRF